MDSQQSDFYGLAILNSFGGKNSNISVWLNFDIKYRGFNWSEITDNYKTLGYVKEHVSNFVHKSEHINWNCVAICITYQDTFFLLFHWQPTNHNCPHIFDLYYFCYRWCDFTVYGQSKFLLNIQIEIFTTGYFDQNTCRCQNMPKKYTVWHKGQVLWNKTLT